MHHFVYWLFDLHSDDLLYIGRSHKPKRRQKDFERLHQRKTRAGVQNRYTHLSDAQDHEIEMIKKYRPPFNKKVTSSPTSLGMKRMPASEETRMMMSAAKLGRTLTEEHKQNIRANSGKYSRPGMRWITNGIETKHYPASAPLPEGWRYGRTFAN